MFKLVKHLHPENAPGPILVTEFGIVKLVKEPQPRNAPCPISVTESGIIKLVKELYSLKAKD